MNSLEQVWEMVLKETTVRMGSVHGPNHWARVERNGIYIAKRTGADELIVRLFALFHDCMRLNDFRDNGHGQRGADFAKSKREALGFLTDQQFEKLYFACQWHTDKIHTDDPTIEACWDADRLDLKRVLIRPKAKYLNTEPAKKMAQNKNFSLLVTVEQRNWRKYLLK